MRHLSSTTCVLSNLWSWSPELMRQVLTGRHVWSLLPVRLCMKKAIQRGRVISNCTVRLMTSKDRFEWAVLSAVDCDYCIPKTIHAHSEELMQLAVGSGFAARINSIHLLLCKSVFFPPSLGWILTCCAKCPEEEKKSINGDKFAFFFYLYHHTVAWCYLMHECRDVSVGNKKIDVTPHRGKSIWHDSSIFREQSKKIDMNVKFSYIVVPLTAEIW